MVSLSSYNYVQCVNWNLSYRTRLWTFPLISFQNHVAPSNGDHFPHLLPARTPIHGTGTERWTVGRCHAGAVTKPWSGKPRYKKKKQWSRQSWTLCHMCLECFRMQIPAYYEQFYCKCWATNSPSSLKRKGPWWHLLLLTKRWYPQLCLYAPTTKETVSIFALDWHDDWCDRNEEWAYNLLKNI